MDSMEEYLERQFTKKVEVPYTFKRKMETALSEENISRHVKVNTLNFMKMVAMFIAVCIVSTGAVFAGVATYQYFATKSSKQDYSVAPGYDYEIDQEFDIKWSTEYSEIYYTKISAYDKYLKAKQIWTQLIEVNEQEYNDYFIIIVSMQNTPKVSMHISNVTADETTTYVELSESEERDNNNTFFSVKVSKEYERDNIEINKISKVPYSDKYISIENLPENYSKTQAIQDGCFVIGDKNNIVSANKEQMEEFITNSKNGKGCFIRIVQYKEDTEVYVMDIEYKDGKYLTARYEKSLEENAKVKYNRYENITLRNTTNIGTIISAWDSNMVQEDTICIYYK